jgi:uncharacterized protein (DUF952 family)
MAAPNPLPSYVYKILPSPAIDPRYAFPTEAGRVAPSQTFYPTQVGQSPPQSLTRVSCCLITKSLEYIDLNDGFVHMSTSAQLGATLERFFGDVPEVQLLKIDFGRLSAFKVVKWEQTSAGVFPHLFSELTGEFVENARTVAKQGTWPQTIELEGWVQH